jgi:phosphoribosyl-AMP cyclohydrolase
MPTTNLFANRSTKNEIENGSVFMPHFDDDGLIPAIVTDAASGTVLMFAWMNAEALSLSLTTKTAHFWSRSRAKIWRKGEESGNILQIEDVRTDCDQDVLLVRAHVAGDGVACHTGSTSCFYRTVQLPETPGTARLVRSQS